MTLGMMMMTSITTYLTKLVEFADYFSKIVCVVLVENKMDIDTQKEYSAKSVLNLKERRVK